MNHIHAKAIRIAQLEHEKALALGHVRALQAYLLNPKFHGDTTVQVADVLARLEPIQTQLLES